MIIFGSNSSHLRSEHLQQVACPHCNTENSIDISVLAKYAHIFWIPAFPMGKVGASQCQHCKQTLKENEMPDQFKSAFKEFKSTLKTPLWHFSGMILISIFVGWSLFAGNQNQKENAISIANPQIGDVYEIKTDDSYYTLLKVTEVKGNDVLIKANKFEVSRSSKLNSIDKEANFEGEEFQLSKENILELFQNGDIIDVNR